MTYYNSTGLWDESALNYNQLEVASDENAPSGNCGRKLSQTISNNDDLFGHSVSLSADGKLLAVGVPGNMVCGSSSDKEGHAKVYEWDESSMNGMNLPWATSKCA